MNRTGIVVAVAACALFEAGCNSKVVKEKQTEAPAHPQDAGFLLTETAAANLGIRFQPVASQPAGDWKRLTGTVQPIESRVTHLRPLARGRILEVLVKIGDRVAAGQPLLRYDNVEAGELRAHYRAASADLQRLRVQEASAARVVQRNQNLVRLGAIPLKDLELAEAERKGMAESIKAQDSIRQGIAEKLLRFGMAAESDEPIPVTVLRAPFNGVVTAQSASVGEMVDTQDELFAIANISDVWVQADVYERDLSHVRVGQSVRVTSAAYPGREFPATIAYVSDLVDDTTRTVRVRCEAPNRDTSLKLGMFVWVELPDAVVPSGVVVPRDAVQESNGKSVVFVKRADGRIEPRQVKTGRSAGSSVEIIEGLQPGDAYAVAGAFHLKNMMAGKQAEE